MMWMSFVMEGNIQERKWLAIECKALKWVKANNAPPKDHLDRFSHGRWDDYENAFTITMTIKQKGLKCIECMNKEDELYDVSICCTKFLKIWPLLTLNWKHLPHPTK
jgi:hypothetical protein